MGLATAGLDRLGNRTDKYYVPNHGGEADLAPALDSAVALAEILVLDEGAGPPRIERLDGISALRAVALNTYRPEYVVLLGREAEHFRQCGEVASEIAINRLIRPWRLDSIDATIDLVLRRWGEAPASRRSRR
jgi:hypothetical protein